MSSRWFRKGGARWCGAISLRGASDAETTAAILDAESQCVVASLPEKEVAELPDLLRGGWEVSRTRPAPSVLRWVLERRGSLVVPVGAFDDRESGMVVLCAERPES
jgi:hypothetical protein